MPLRDRKVYGIKGPIPAGYFLGRLDGGEGDVQLLSFDDILAAGLQQRIMSIATTVAETNTSGDYLLDGGDPPGFISDGAGNLLRAS